MISLKKVTDPSGSTISTNNNYRRRRGSPIKILPASKHKLT
jgi:hypothetical protein